MKVSYSRNTNISVHNTSHIIIILTSDAVGDLRKVEVGFVPQMSAGGDGGQVQTSRKVDVCIIQRSR